MGRSIVVALSGGVDSAVAAWLLVRAGHDVQGLHMTNWEDDAYCDAARDFQDARAVCNTLGIPLHRVNFAAEYRERVFADFLAEHRRGRTPNPDVLCNREIKFGVMRRYARRLGAELLATGHYARVAFELPSGELRERTADAAFDPGDALGVALLKGQDASKDQSYFLHAVASEDLRDALFPLGALEKRAVRALARSARLPVADKKDSTGICFIGERPFAQFLRQYLPDKPGIIRDADGQVRGEHRGLAYYTLGQRQGIGIGGVSDASAASVAEGSAGRDARTSSGEAWYVAAKEEASNELIVVRGHDHPLLYANSIRAERLHWIGTPPEPWRSGGALRCHAKIRYRQADQACTVTRSDAALEVSFDHPQRTPTPGQYLVLYDRERCLGGATIETAAMAAHGCAASAASRALPPGDAAISL